MITVQLSEEPAFIFLRWILPATSPWMIHSVKFHMGSALSRMDLSYRFSFGLISPSVFQLSNLTLSSQATGCPWFYWLLLSWGHYHGMGGLSIKHSYNSEVEKLIAYHVTGHRFLSRLQLLENSSSFFFHPARTENFQRMWSPFCSQKHYIQTLKIAYFPLVFPDALCFVS